MKEILRLSMLYFGCQEPPVPMYMLFSKVSSALPNFSRFLVMKQNVDLCILSAAIVMYSNR